MADKAILFDSSRCSACQACVAACKGRFGLGPASSSEDMAARAFGRAAVLDEEAPLAVARFERTLADGGTVWEAARAGCVHCAEAPCAEVCPTGALAVSGETGFVTLDAERCVSCHLCAMVCPADAPRHRGERGELCLCDGCAAEVAEGGVPACVAACPLDALAFDDRDAVVSRANERAAALRERGWANASVLGVSEQGGHHVVQVMKYGVGGSMHEALASTGEVEWLDAVKAAGPASVGVLGLAAAGAVAGLVSESRKQRTAEAEAAAASMATFNPLLDNESVEGGEGADGDAREVVEESALQAALRRRNALRTKKGATPGAAAAAALAAVPVEEYHWYNADAAGDDEAEGFEPRLVSCGRARFGMKDYGVAYGWSGDFAGDTDDTGEIPVIDELSDTGELYDVEEFNRLLAEDAALAEETARAAEAGEADDSGSDDEAESTEAVEAEGSSGDSRETEEAVAETEEPGVEEAASDEKDGDSTEEPGV